MKKIVQTSGLLIVVLGLISCGGGSSSSSSNMGSNIPAESGNPPPESGGNQPIPPSSVSGNPYTGAYMYVDQDYATQVNTFLSANQQYKAKASPYLNGQGSWDISTSVWIDRESAIAGYNNGTSYIHGVTWHLQQALQQAQANSKPVVVSFVVYDLPNRDCDAYSSNGEIVIQSNSSSAADTALTQYESQYITPINNAINSFYSSNPTAKNSVRVVLLIEPDSLPNMITNATSTQSCTIVSNYNVYERGVSYALKQFNTGASESAVYMYLDIAHSAWLGWQTNANQIHTIYNNIEPGSSAGGAQGLGAGFNKLRGFIVNTSNYTPVSEAFSYADYLNNNTIISSQFYAWNDVYSLDSYISEIMSLSSDTGQLVIGGGGHQIMQPTSALYKNMHFLLDTSRNNWTAHQFSTGGVNYNRNDLRTANANWCNVQNISLNGSIVSPGIGNIPQADPTLANPLYSGTLPVDAYIWVKPPGQSDGYYNQSAGTGDQMCSSGVGGSHNGNVATDSLQGSSNTPAPPAGNWFDQAFIQLLTSSNN